MPRQVQQQIGSRDNAEEDVSSRPGDGDDIMEEEVQEEGYASSTPTSSLTWITWFCSLPGHEYFCEVHEDFLEDEFNLTGLNSMVPFWKEALDMVLDVEAEEDSLKIPDVSIIEASAELTYGLVHQRYILSRMGLNAMAEKYEVGHFGTCPRVYCHSCHVVPCGRADLPGLDTVKLYCPNCNDIYTPPSSKFQGVDGAFFGTTFPHLFFQTYREYAPTLHYMPSENSSVSGRSPLGGNSPQALIESQPYGGQKQAAGRIYTAKIYGFRVSERAKCGPRMRWLRQRPQHPSELAQVDWRGRWIGSDDDFEGDEDDGVGGQMEDFDPDAIGEDDDDDDDDDDDEDDNVTAGGTASHSRQQKNHLVGVDLCPPTPINVAISSSVRSSLSTYSSPSGVWRPLEVGSALGSILTPNDMLRQTSQVKTVRAVG